MGVEIERKFLVASDAWRDAVTSSTRMRQGYLATDEDRSVRVRLAGEKAVLTIKKRIGENKRLEFEYGIPVEDADVLLDQICDRPLIEKTRHINVYGGLTWEIDVFEGDNEGLIVAEVELEHEDQIPDLPDWLGREVTDDSRYYNASLVAHPFKNW